MSLQFQWCSGKLQVVKFLGTGKPSCCTAGSAKDAGGEIVEISVDTHEVWLVQGSKEVFMEKVDVSSMLKGDLTKSYAHWYVRFAQTRPLLQHRPHSLVVISGCKPGCLPVKNICLQMRDKKITKQHRKNVLLL